MSIEWFDDESRQSNELPWVKDWIADGNESGVPITINSAYICPTGILVLTDEWKGFIYKGSKTHTQLSEALEAYLLADRCLPRLVACPNDSGKVRCGLDRSVEDAAWAKHGKEYCQVLGEYGTDHSAFQNKREVNPLLPPIPTSNSGGTNGTIPTRAKRKTSAP